MIKKVAAVYSISLVQLLHAVQLESITVESSKLGTNEIDIPSTIHIFANDVLEMSHSNSIHTLSAILPNTNISGLGNRTDTTLSIRGVANYLTTESSVAMYVDDAAIPMSYGFGSIDFSNISRIEVFQGAQGTDFGKNAESGVINMYTKPITDSLESEASIDYASFNSKKIYGRVSGPGSINNLGFSLAITDDRSDGYITNTLMRNKLDYRHLTNFNTKLKYKVNSNFDLSFNYTKMKSDDGGNAFKIDTKNDPYSIDNEPQNDSTKMNNDLISFVANYAYDNKSLTSITSYGRQSIQKKDYISRLGSLNLAMDDQTDITIKEVSEELRMKGVNKKFDYVMGGFFSKKLRFNYIENQIFPTLSAYNNSNNLDNLDTNKALFGKVRYAINPTWSFISGIRYQQTKRDFTRDYTGFTSVLSSSVLSEHWLPTFSLSYDKNGNNAYLTYSKGYRPGGFNYRSSGTTLVPYLPEITESFELGLKKNINDTWNINSAVFYNLMNDVRTITVSDYLATTTYNADKAHSYGVESSIRYSSDNLEWYTNLGLTKTEFDTFMVGTTDYAGKHLIDIPDMTLALGGKYKLDTNWYTNASLTYMGKRYYDIANTKEENGYTTVNTAIGYKNKKYSAEIYANNLFDIQNVDFLIHTPSHDYYHFGAPRVIGFHIGISIN